ncbi:hypothetical protein H9649_14495 [Sporosarcina sp. Sa2YVA2]|uniref:Uncharacterized protein n=1 Tax=Sporosarcina quadrami TaxID=2762234 RepID=A0ABR8UCQ4_9BACL|nr:hypothetical protein [Sporosarcina quadrami]MBD7985796.1 hypothetical protein [Sporosarcina quadrami]
MGLMFTTVIGYSVVLLLAALFTMHFLGKALDSSDAEKIDPKPEVK